MYTTWNICTDNLTLVIILNQADGKYGRQVVGFHSFDIDQKILQSTLCVGMEMTEHQIANCD